MEHEALEADLNGLVDRVIGMVVSRPVAPTSVPRLPVASTSAPRRVSAPDFPAPRDAASSRQVAVAPSRDDDRPSVESEDDVDEEIPSAKSSSKKVRWPSEDLVTVLMPSRKRPNDGTSFSPFSFLSADVHLDSSPISKKRPKIAPPPAAPRAVPTSDRERLDELAAIVAEQGRRLATVASALTRWKQDNAIAWDGVVARLNDLEDGARMMRLRETARARLHTVVASSTFDVALGNMPLDHERLLQDAIDTHANSREDILAELYGSFSRVSEGRRGRLSADREVSEREAAEREVAERETAEREAAEREAAEREPGPSASAKQKGKARASARE